ncbi:N-acetyl sugar amidotransferase [Aquimarina sp. MAR_2010_214]|uniref:N-acetyl sugar amidotransferase n=1 Tax=Aquimarina sp. MAR_2010_214 TaxID=1250026 RepID=UPI000C70442E|nr:N-acetyl sugar amidotransferase [Aquimarina sp. MAR_2010_214]PKV48779.1 N-acetyl sugar amidotransferase [Aquimarina sp. MAR_2010_214]
MKNEKYQICKRCIMDTTDSEIVFDAEGNCNHCNDALARKNDSWKPNKEGEERLLKIVDRIKKEEKNKEYDCVLGLSGGVDSSYMAYKAHELGLRPLVVHVDCGWNSELAVKNIENIITMLGFELHTHVVDWQEMKDLQLAYFKANVANQDVPQDHAIFAALYSFAVKNNIKYVLNGSNFATESILPKTWGYGASDLVNLKDIHKKFGKKKLKKFPKVSFFKWYIYFPFIRKMKILKILNLLPYSKDEAIEVMKKEIGWQYYGGKHHESRFTKFFQAYYLPTKFGYDKRRAHLSSLIVSNQLSREEALKEMEIEIYPNNSHIDDMEFVAKKLGVSLSEFEKIIQMPNKSYDDYKNIEKWFSFGMKVRDYFKKDV